MANKKDLKIFNDLNSWLHDELGTNALQHDNFKDLEDLGFRNELELGTQMHNIKRSLEKIGAAYARYGLYPVFKEMPHKQGTEIIYRPVGEDSQDIKDSECPSIVISTTKDGFSIHNNMLSPNSALIVRGRGGEFGIASSLSVGLDEAVKEIETSSAWIEKSFKKSTKEGLSYIRSTTNKAIRSVTQLNPSIYSSNQVKEFSKLDPKNLKALRPEALQAMKAQMITAYYIQSVYNANERTQKYGAPSQKKFTQTIEDIFSASRAFEDFSQLDNYVKSHYSWVYHNVWKGDVENVFKKITGKITQGGMTEGTMGRIGFKEPDVPFARLAAVGKKTKQNLQVYPQNSNYYQKKKTVAVGSTILFTQSQLNNYKKKIASKEMTGADKYKDLYTSGEFTDQDLKTAYEQIKKEYDSKKSSISAEEFREIQQMALKGFGEDASFMSASMNKEFARKEEKKYLKDKVFDYKTLNEEVKQILLAKREKDLARENNKKNSNKEKIKFIEEQIKALSLEETDVRAKNDKGSYVFGDGASTFKELLAKKYGLDSESKIRSFEVDSEGKLFNVLKVKPLHNESFVIRAGATGDWRSVMSVLNDTLAGRALEVHGYSKDEIYVNGHDASDGLKIHTFNNADREIKDKTIRTDINKTASYVFNYLLREKGTDVETARKLLSSQEILSKYFSITDNGDVKTNEEQFAKDIQANTPKSGEIATDLLQSVVKFGQEVGAYSANTEYFKEVDVDGKKILAQLRPMVTATEIAISSTPRYPGLGSSSHSVAKKGPHELASAEATLGELSEWLLQNNYTGSDYEKAIAPMRKYVNRLRTAFREQEKGYDSYVKNASYLSKTFTKDAVQFQNDIRKDKRVITLSLEEINSLDAESVYDEDGITAGEKLEGNGENKLGIYIQNLKEVAWGLLSEAERNDLGLKSADDFQVGVDLGDNYLGGNTKNGALGSRMIMLGKGSYNKELLKDSGIYSIDKELSVNNAIVRALQGYYRAGANEKDAAGRRALSAILNGYEYFQDSYSEGSIFEKYHTLRNDKSSGYLLLQGMSDEASEVLKDIVLRKPRTKEDKERIEKNLNGVQKILNIEDFKEALRARYKENAGEVKDWYAQVTGKQAGKRNLDTIVNAIAKHYDISDKDYDGAVIDNTMINRNPTINFVNDLLGGSAVLTSKSEIVGKGNLMVNKSLISIGHGDMDGDLAAFFIALDQGDVEGANAAITAFYKDAALRQGAIDTKEKQEYADLVKKVTKELDPNGTGQYRIHRVGDVAKINSVLKDVDKKIAIASMWTGKKGAGIYGDDKFKFEEIIDKTFGTENRSGNYLENLGGRVFAGLGQTLYQEGINIKNLKLEDGLNLTDEEKATLMLEKANSAMNMSYQRATWDDEDTRRHFFSLLGGTNSLNIFNPDAVFKDNTLSNLGLQNITKGSPILKDLRTLAEKTKVHLTKKFGEDSQEVERISKDLAAIQEIEEKGGTLQNMTIELANALYGVFAAEVAHQGETVGEQMRGVFYKKGNGIPRLGYATGYSDYDEASKKALAPYLEKQNSAEKTYQDRYQQIIEAKASGYYTSTTAAGRNRILEGGKATPADFEILSLAKQYAEAEKEEEKKNLIKQRNSAHQSRLIQDSIPAITALLAGTISHRVSEILMNNNDEKTNFKTSGEAYAYLASQDPAFVQNIEKQIEFALTEKYGGTDADTQIKRAEFIGKSAFKGGANYRVLQSKMKQQGGKALGAEMALTGFSNVERGSYDNVSQITDLLYYTVGEDGRITVHVVDYKNAADGQPTFKNIAEIKDYQDSLMLLNKDIQTAQTGGLQFNSAEEYFGSDTDIAKDWKQRLMSEAQKDAGGKTSGEEFRKAFEKRKKDLTSLIKIFNQGMASFVGELIINSAEGVVNDFTVDLNKGPLNDWFYNIYKKRNVNLDDLLTKNSEEIKGMMENSITGVESYAILTEENKARIFSPEQKKALESVEKLYDAKGRLSNAELYKDYLERQAGIDPTNQSLKEKISEQNQIISDTKKALGSARAFKNVERWTTELSEIETELSTETDSLKKDELSKKSKQLIDKIEEAKTSLHYLMEKAIEDINGLVIYDEKGEAQGFAEGASLLNIEKQQYASSLRENNKQRRRELSEAGLRYNNSVYRKIAQESALANARLQNPLLTEEEKYALSDEALEKGLQRAKILMAIEEDTKNLTTKARKNSRKDKVVSLLIGGKKEDRVFLNAQGKSISAQDAQNAGMWIDTQSIDEEARTMATKKVEAESRKAMLTLEAKAIQYYKEQYKIVDEIESNNKKLEFAKKKNDVNEINYYEAEAERLEKKQELSDLLIKNGFEEENNKTEKGREILANAKEYVELSRKLEKDLKDKSGDSNNTKNGGIGFLGINAGVVNWLSRLMSGGFIYRFIGTIKKAIRDFIQQAKQLDQVMTNLRIVTGKNSSDARTLMTRYSELGKTLGATTTEVAQSATQWLRQGYEVAQVNELIESSIYLSKLGMIDAGEAIRDLTSAMHGFKLEATDAMSIVDKLTSLDVKAATTAGDIAQGLSQFASIASLNGVNLDQAAAYVATIADVNQESGTTVGQSLKTIMSRYGNVKAGAYNKLNIDSESEDTTEKLNDVERILSKMGISIRKTNLEFKDFDEVLEEMADRWGTMDNVSKKAIANAFAGIRQQNSFLILMENYDKYKELLEVSESSEGTASRKYQSYRESYAAARNEFMAATEGFVNSSGISKLLTDLTNIGTKMFELLEKFYSYIPGFLSLLGYYRTAMGHSVPQVAYKMWSQREKEIGERTGKTFSERFKENTLLGRLIKKHQDKKVNKEEEKAQKEQIKLEEKKVELSKQEALNKEQTLNAGKEESQMKENTVQSGKQEQVEKDSVAQKAAIESQEKDATVNKGVQEEMNKEQVVQDSKTEAQNKEQVVQSSKEEAANEQGGSTGGGKAAGGMSKGMAVMTGVSLFLNELMTSISQFATAGVTHDYNGKSVESSKEAQEKAGAVSAAISFGLPIIGSFIGPAVAEGIAAEYDKQRDYANAETERATELTSKLEGISSKIQDIGASEMASGERHKLVREFRKEIFSDENLDLRKSLQNHLGNKNISEILDSIDSNTESSVESLKELQQAQIHAEMGQVHSKYATQMFELNQQLGDKLSAIDDIEMPWDQKAGNVTKTAVATGVGGTVGGVLTGMAIGASIGEAATPIGAAIGAIVGAVAGLIIGGVSGYIQSEAEETQMQHNYKGTYSWQGMSLEQKIDAVRSQIQEVQIYQEKVETEVIDDEVAAKTLDKGASGALREYQELLAALQQQQTLQYQMISETNDLILESALVSAKTTEGSKERYLSDMTVEQLKSLGITGILTNYAKAVDEEGGLGGINIWDESGEKLSESGYDYLYSKIRQLGDEEINAVLSGESYTLEQALALTDSIEKQRILKNFADSLNVTVDDLILIQDKFSKLTLADTYSSVEDLDSKITNLASTMSSAAESAGQMSSWVRNLISQFPQLTVYMGDLSEFYRQSIILVQQYANQYLEAQYEVLTDNGDLFTSIKDELYEAIGDSAADALRENKNVGKISDIISWIQGEYDVKSGTLSEAADTVLKELKATMDKAGIKVVSQELKSFYENLINFRTQQIDKQVENLESQKEALKEITSQREYENRLVEARLKLEDAEKQKKRVYRAGIGWVYESDQSAIEEAQKNLQSVETEKTISALDERISNLQGQKTELSEVYEKENYETLGKLYNAAVDEGKILSSSLGFIESIRDSVDGISKDMSEMIGSEVKKKEEEKTTAIKEAKRAWDELNSGKFTPGTKDYNMALTNFHKLMETAYNNNATDEDFADWKTYSLSDSNGMNRIAQGSSATEVYKGNINDQLTAVRSSFLLKGKSGEWYSGYAPGDLLADPTVAEYLYAGLKSGAALVWGPDGRLLTGVDYYATESDGSLAGYFQRMAQNGKTQLVVSDPYIDNEAVLFSNGQLYRITNNSGRDTSGFTVVENPSGKAEFNKEVMSNATGNVGLPHDSLSWINELGTEALITPQGTLTALPSKTGIIPADITKNLWELGEVAPSFVDSLKKRTNSDIVGKSIFDGVLNDDSFNIDNLVMNVTADSSFDVDRFVSLIKSRVALTKNNK